MYFQPRLGGQISTLKRSLISALATLDSTQNLPQTAEKMQRAQNGYNEALKLNGDRFETSRMINHVSQYRNRRNLYSACLILVRDYMW